MVFFAKLITPKARFGLSMKFHRAHCTRQRHPVLSFPPCMQVAQEDDELRAMLEDLENE